MTDISPRDAEKQEVSFLACVIEVLKNLGVTFCLDGELIAPSAETDDEGEE